MVFLDMAWWAEKRRKKMRDGLPFAHFKLAGVNVAN
jgi:hypothetical protein